MVSWETIFNFQKILEDKRPVDRTPIDKKLELFSEEYNIQRESPVLIKFLIPKDECITVIAFLNSLGYNAAKLFPGYDGITKMIKEEALIYKATLDMAKSLKSQT